MTNKQDKAQTLLHMQHTWPKPGGGRLRGDTGETWTYSLVPHEKVSTILSIQVTVQVTQIFVARYISGSQPTEQAPHKTQGGAWMAMVATVSLQVVVGQLRRLSITYILTG